MVLRSRIESTGRDRKVLQVFVEGDEGDLAGILWFPNSYWNTRNSVCCNYPHLDFTGIILQGKGEGVGRWRREGEKKRGTFNLS